MRLAVMQPYFFPYIGYYQAIGAVDRYILYDNVNFIKKGYMTRNRYLVVNGEPAYLIVPVREKSSYRRISQVELVADRKWRTAMLNTLYMNYKRCPYFEDVFPVVENVLHSDTDFLTTLNARSIMDVGRYLDISTEIVSDVRIYDDLEEKLNNLNGDAAALFPYLKLKQPDRKVIRAIEICRREKADVLVNAFGGLSLYDKEEFSRNEITLFFIKTDGVSYTQRSRSFYPNLSIIDVLMNCGKKETRELLQKYTLI